MNVSSTEAKRHLDKLIARALRGEEIIICRWGAQLCVWSRFKWRNLRTRQSTALRVDLSGKFQIRRVRSTLGNDGPENRRIRGAPFTPLFSSPTVNSHCCLGLR
jgi:hypothetical protein